MNVKRVIVGLLDTNCYILEFDNKCMIIDPGDESEKIINKIEKEVVGIIITHRHSDHIGALDDLLKKYKTKVYDINNLKEGLNIISNIEFDVIFNPGHRNDCISIYFKNEKKMFVGDFIFEGSIGRWDLEYASSSDMKNSINKILKYPKDITLYPGHGEKTTLENEENNLIFFMNTYLNN